MTNLATFLGADIGVSGLHSRNRQTYFPFIFILLFGFFVANVCSATNNKIVTVLSDGPRISSSSPVPPPANYCDSEIYQCINISGVGYLKKLDMSTNPMTYSTVASFSGVALNAMGYNSIDGKFYAVNTNTKKLVSITTAGVMTDLNTILPISPNCGDIDTLGNYYFKSGSSSTIYKINLNVQPYTITSFTTSTVFYGADMAFNPYTNRWYAMRNNIMSTLNPTNNTVTNQTITGLISTAGDYGANWFASDGFYYVSRNTTGTIYKVNLATNTAVIAGLAQITSSNDGARCPTAPMVLFPPVANDNAVTIQEDASATIPNIVANDTDVDGTVVMSTIDLDPNTVGQQTSITTAAGAWSVNTSTGVVSFVPVANYNGNATTTYTVQDNTGRLSNAAVLTVVVVSVNDVPIANNNSISGQEDQVVVLTDVDGNDVDIDGSVLASTIDLDVLAEGIQHSKTTNHGTYVVNTTSGDVTFTPVAHWNGTTTLNYTIQDNQGATSYSATLTVTLSAVNDPPIITADLASVNEDAVYVNLSQITNNDFEPEAEQIVKSTIDLDPGTAGQQTTRTTIAGNWSVNLTDGTVTFNPADNYFGTAQITYTVQDINGNVSAPGDIIVTVNPVNDVPIAIANSVTSGMNELATITDITLNDYDVEDGLLVSTIDLDPNTAGQQTSITTVHGTWNVNTLSGNVTFMPNTNYLGTTSIQYTIKDTNGATSNLAALNATIIVLNHDPVANDNTVTGNEDAVYINIPNIQDNDTDEDGDEELLTNSIDLDTLASGQQTSITTAEGSWSVDTGTGTVTFVPVTNYNGTALAYYRIKDDNNAWSNVATLTVNVQAVNDLPWAIKDSTFTNSNITVALMNIAANDYDLETSVVHSTIDMDTLTAGIQSSITNAFGSWTYNTAQQRVIFVPASNFQGMAYAYYTIADTQGGRSLPGMLQVEVYPPLPITSTPNPNQSMFSSCGSGNMVTANTDSWNSAWTDYNNDGWEDLFVALLDTNSTSQLYRGLGSGNFDQITNLNIVNQNWLTVGGLWADVDNDGDQDVILINDTSHPSKLFKNNGNGSFTEVLSSGLNITPQYYHGGSFVDYDNDGFVDLLLTNYFETRFHELYHNDGDGTFTPVTTTPITMESRKSLGPVWGDYNNDGNQDLFIPNGDGQNNSLFRNNGNGTFTKVTSGAIVNDGGNSVGACWGDIDRDGDIDLFVANASGENNFLYTNNGNETFSKVTTDVVVTDGGHSHGCHFVDMDNDGDLDLYVTNDEGVSFVYTNDGDGTFSRKTNEANALSFGNAFGQAWSDFDKDGDMDVYVSTHSNNPNALFCNAGNSYKWINIKLQGVVSNRDGIGAKVRVKAGGFWQTSQVSAQNGFNGQHSMRQHFGFGSSTIIDSIQVNWPSGIVQKMAFQNTNEFITIVEPNSSTIQGVAYHDLDGDCVMDNGEPALANRLISVAPIGLVASTDENGHYELSLSPGSYTLDGINNGIWVNDCSGQSQTVVGTSNQYTINVPFEASASGIDLVTGLTSTAWRRGFTNLTGLQYSNNGSTAATNVVLTVTYPANTVPVSASIPWTNAVGQVYTWIIGSMPAGSTYYIQITDSVKLEATTGEFLELRSNISGSGNELNSSNNLFSLMNEIVGPLDPNDMRVYPIGEGLDGIVDLDQMLTYTVRFQNVGTYPATNVIIKSPIPDYMDIESFEVVSASHNYTYHILEDQQLEIIFTNIHLPDSTSDESGSHGVVSFRMKPLRSVVGGELVYNIADIHFDYEEPVTTNQVKNKLKVNYENGSDLVIWPNPSTGLVNFEINETLHSEKQTIAKVLIFDGVGKLVHVRSNMDMQRVTYNPNNIESGVYQVVVEDIYGNKYTGRMTIRKP